MLQVFIIEDEWPARKHLAGLLAKTVPPSRIVGMADSVAAAARWLQDHPAPDLIFADIQLGDGLSLDLFQRQPPECPVVFVTAHDAYLLEAFKNHGIAYLLKPIDPAAVHAALQKYRTLGRHFADVWKVFAASLAKPTGLPVRQRILAQRGVAHQPVAFADVAYFFSENKLTFLVTRSGEKLLVNEPLSTLADDLHPIDFFRINRNYLAHASAVKSFMAAGKGRLVIELRPPAAGEIVVSQESAARFRVWLGR